MTLHSQLIVNRIHVAKSQRSMHHKYSAGASSYAYPGKGEVQLLQNCLLCCPLMNYPEQRRARICTLKKSMQIGKLMHKLTLHTSTHYTCTGVTAYLTEPHQAAIRELKPIVGDGTLQDTRFSMKQRECGGMG